MLTEEEIEIIKPLINEETRNWMSKTSADWQRYGYNITEPHGYIFDKKNYNWKMMPVDDNPVYKKSMSRYISAFYGACGKFDRWMKLQGLKRNKNEPI